MHRTIAALIAVAASSGGLRAQPAPTLAPGQRVRLSAPAAHLAYEDATLVAATRDTIVIRRLELRPDAGSWRVDTVKTAVALRDVKSLEVFRGQRPPVWRAVLIGGAIGAGVGAAIGSGTHDVGGNCLGCVAIPGWYAGAVAGGLLGAAAGYGIASMQPAERWEVVPLGAPDRLQVGLMVSGRGRLGLGMALPF